jgi:hypothetical protein
LRREVECKERVIDMTCVDTIRRNGGRLVRKGIKRYVKARIAGVRFRKRRAKGLYNPQEADDSANYHPTQFRYTSPLLTTELPTITLEIPDFELWITEFWNDFCIEPTPYLVASAIVYLGFVLLLTQYYVAIWRLSCFLLQFVPWDDELNLG